MNIFEKYLSIRENINIDHDEVIIEIPKEDLRKLNFIQRKHLNILLTSDNKYIIKYKKTYEEE